MRVDRFTIKIILCTFSMLFNLVTIASVFGAILSVIQLLIVFYFIITRQWEKALIWHFIFWACSISVATASSLFQGDHNIAMYNYSRLELYGPLKFSYIISVILWVRAANIKSNIKTDILLYRLYKIVLFFVVSGSIIGFIGFIIDSNYNVDGAVTYGLYILLTVISLYTFLKFDNPSLRENCFSWSKALLMSAVYSGAIGFSIGLRGAYATQETRLCVDLFYFVPILFVGFFSIKERVYNLLAIVMAIPLFLFSSGGKTILLIGTTIVFLAISCIFIEKGLSPYEIRKRKWLRMICVILLIVVICSGKIGGLELGELSSNKLHNVTSLISSTNFNDIDRSPAIRVATLANIINNNIYNPIYLFFGRGYGGYFTDDLGLFNGLDVWLGGWPEEVCRKGIYPSAHDTFAAVPLVNGLYGLYLIIMISYMYLRNFRRSFLSLSVIPWLLLTFYANINYAYIGVFLLYSSTYQLDSDS